MKYLNPFDINASLYEYLNQDSNLKSEHNRKLCLEYEKYIHIRINEEQVRCSDFNFYLTSDEDHSTSLLKENETPECNATKSMKICNWCYTIKSMKICNWCYSITYKNKGSHIINELEPSIYIKHVKGHYYFHQTEIQTKHFMHGTAMKRIV
jgi:hypothetical protein